MTDETVRLGSLRFLEVAVQREEGVVILVMVASQDPGTKGAVERFGCLLTVAHATNLNLLLRNAIQSLNG